MNNRRQTIHPVSSVLKKLMQRSEFQAGDPTSIIIDEWNNIIDPSLKKGTELVKVEDGVLYVRTFSSAYRAEISYMKKNIINAANSILGSRIIIDLRFV